MKATKLNVRLYGDTCLRKKSTLVKEVGIVERFLIQAMLNTMHAYKGIGLAAPQVGVNQQILVADIGNGPIVVINPQIVKKVGTAVMEEGCLSLPGINVQVKRAKNITVRYLDEHNRSHEKSFEDLLARVIQHETDHLNGKLIIDYANLAEKRKLIREYKNFLEKKESLPENATDH